MCRSHRFVWHQHKDWGLSVRNPLLVLLASNLTILYFTQKKEESRDIAVAKAIHLLYVPFTVFVEPASVTPQIAARATKAAKTRHRAMATNSWNETPK